MGSRSPRLPPIPISPRLTAASASPIGHAAAHGSRIPSVRPVIALAAAPNPLQSPRGGNGRVAGFTTGFLYVCSGAPVQQVLYSDDGLSKRGLMHSLESVRHARGQIRQQRREDHAKKLAAAQREQSEYKAIQRRHERLMREYHRHNDERFRAAQVVQFMWRRHYKLNTQTRLPTVLEADRIKVGRRSLLNGRKAEVDQGGRLALETLVDHDWGSGFRL